MPVGRVVDLSQDLYHGCPGVPGFPPPRIELLRVGASDGWTVEQLTMSLHWGTHLDAPAHLGDFETTMDQIPVARLQGPAAVVDLRDLPLGSPIGPRELERAPKELSGKIILLATGAGQRRSWSRAWVYGTPYLTPEGAAYLVERGVRGVGIDHPSIGGLGETNEETHRRLLGAGVWIAEGLEFPEEAFSPGDWTCLALPVKIRQSSGGPARVVLVEWRPG